MYVVSSFLSWRRAHIHIHYCPYYLRVSHLAKNGQVVSIPGISEYIDCSKTWSFNSLLADIPLGGAKYIKKAQLLEVLVEVWVEGVWGGEGIRKNWTNDPGSVRKSLHRNSVPEQCF